MHLPRLVLLLLILSTSIENTWAQFGPTKRRSISRLSNLDELVSSEAQAYLNQIDAYLEAQQYSEAVEAIQRVMSSFPDKVVPVAEGNQALGMRAYGHFRLSNLPPEALELYRKRVDPQARQWYDQGVDQRDSELLERVVREFYASSWADDAFFKLGEFALSDGDYAKARECWEQLLSPAERGLKQSVGLKLPATEIPRADVFARLILVSILDGSTQRAKTQLTKQMYGGAGFQEQFPNALGQLAGRRGSYVDLLSNLLKESKRWAPLESSSDWPTYGGSIQRTAQQPKAVNIASKAWKEPIPLQPVKVLPASISRQFSLRRIGEQSGQPLSYFPLVIDDKLIVHHRPQLPDDGTRCKDRILVYNLQSGKPYWPVPQQQLEVTAALPGEIFSSAESAPRYTFTSLDIPRYTMTVYRNLLFARVGSPVTYRQGGNRLNQEEPPSSIVCLDLAAKGKLVWEIPADNTEWAFEGAPVCDGQRVYVGMKQRLGNPKPFVACYDAETAKLLWRQVLPSADTWNFGGDEVELSHNLITLGTGTIYYNTNLGSIAALDSKTGELRWITLYPRQEHLNLNQPQGYYYRSLNPCVFDRGVLYVAPRHTDAVMAIDSLTGQLLWELSLPDVTHLLGVYNNQLLASGDRIYWIEFDPTNRSAPGKLNHHWFGTSGPKGYGRGTLAEGHVYWPSREQVMVFDAETAQLKQIIQLWQEPAFREFAGNLLISNDVLIVAQPDQLVAFHGYSEALEEQLEREARANPKSATHWLALGRCQAKLRRWKDAAASFETSLSLAENLPVPPFSIPKVKREHLDVLYQQIAELIESKQYPEASNAIRQAQGKSDSARHQARLKLYAAEIASAQGDQDTAVEIWTMLQISSEVKDTLIDRGDGRFRTVFGIIKQKLHRDTGATEVLSSGTTQDRKITHNRSPLLTNPIQLASASSELLLLTAKPSSQTICLADSSTISGYSIDGSEVRWRQSINPGYWRGNVIDSAVWVMHCRGCERYDIKTGEQLQRLSFSDIHEPVQSLLTFDRQLRPLWTFSDNWIVAPIYDSTLAIIPKDEVDSLRTLSVVGEIKEVLPTSNSIHIVHLPFQQSSECVMLSSYQLPDGRFLRASELAQLPDQLVEAGEKLLIQTNQQLVSLHPETHRRLWQQNLPSDADVQLVRYHTERDCFVTGLDNGDLFCLDASSGHIRWSTSLNTDDTTPASYLVDRDCVYTLKNGLLYAIGLDAGKPAWDRPKFLHARESIGLIFRFEAQLFVGVSDSNISQVFNLQPETGELIQRVVLDSPAPIQQLIGTTEALYVVQKDQVSTLRFDTSPNFANRP